MKKVLFTVLFLFLGTNVCCAEEPYINPIDRQESACKEKSLTLEDWVRCTRNSANSWGVEVDKYYSLLYKKMTGDAKTALFEDQKYWNMYKNNEIKVLNALYNEQYETKERLIFRADQKRNIVKNRAESLRLYYIQTFPDDDKEKIKINTDNNNINDIFQRGLRYIGF